MTKDRLQPDGLGDCRQLLRPPESRVDAVQLADGSLLTATDIDAIVQQMSAYAVQEGIALSTLDDVRSNDALMTLVAGSGHAV